MAQAPQGADEVDVGLLDFALGLADLGGGPFNIGLGLDDSCATRSWMLNNSISAFCCSASRPWTRRDAQAEIVEGPDQADAHVGPPAPGVGGVGWPAAEDPAHDRAAGPFPFQHHAGQQRAEASWRSSSKVACTTARCEASSGRFNRPQGIRSSTPSCGATNVTSNSGGSMGTVSEPGFRRSSRASRALAMRHAVRSTMICCFVSAAKALAVDLKRRHQSPG